MKCPSKTSTGGFARFHQIIRKKCAQVFHIISQNDTANIATHQKIDLWYYNNMGSHGHTMKFLSNGLQNLSAIWKGAYEIMIFYPTSTFVEIKFFLFEGTWYHLHVTIGAVADLNSSCERILARFWAWLPDLGPAAAAPAAARHKKRHMAISW